MKKICDAVRFRINLILSYILCASTEQIQWKKGELSSEAIGGTRTHALSTSQRHNIALNHRSIYADFCFNFYCINNRYSAVAACIASRLYDRHYAIWLLSRPGSCRRHCPTSNMSLRPKWHIEREKKKLRRNINDHSAIKLFICYWKLFRLATIHVYIGRECMHFWMRHAYPIED